MSNGRQQVIIRQTGDNSFAVFDAITQEPLLGDADTNIRRITVRAQLAGFEPILYIAQDGQEFVPNTDEQTFQWRPQ